jgi:hypothetical protein
VLQLKYRRSRVLVAGLVASMNGGPTIRGNSLQSRRLVVGGALLGTWVSVIAGSHAHCYSPACSSRGIRLAAREASLSRPTLRRRVLLWKRNFM